MKATESAIRTFAQGDDAAYEEWVGQHGGYVLTQRSSRGGEFMLHDSDCLHLELTSGSFRLTARPRRWAKTRQPLVEWATEHNGSKPLLCQTCM
jgi:hypothetical protein